MAALPIPAALTASSQCRNNEAMDTLHLPPLMIGNITIGFPVVQAALSGYSDMAMRVIARRLGADYTLCEVMLDRLILQGGKKSRRFLAVSDEEHPVGGQLMGSDPAEFGPAARELVEAGYDVID